MLTEWFNKRSYSGTSRKTPWFLGNPAGVDSCASYFVPEAAAGDGAVGSMVSSLLVPPVASLMRTQGITLASTAAAVRRASKSSPPPRMKVVSVGQSLRSFRRERLRE